MAYAALVSLARTINQILNHDHSPTTLPIYQEIIRSIRDHAVTLQSFLENFPEKANSLEGQIREVANTAEDVIEFLLSEFFLSDCSVGVSSSAKLELQLKEVAEQLKSTAGYVVDCVKHVRRRSDSSVVSSSSRRAATSSKDVVFGSHEDLFQIMMQLTCSSSSRLQVLPIVGMGGIGKTILAKLVYNSPPIMEHFDIRGWVTVSRDYSVASIASSLLASMKGISDVEREIPMESLIHEYLMGGRYLIVMDDVWSTKAWDDVRKLFPENDNGSRIILTTRLQDVAF